MTDLTLLQYGLIALLFVWSGFVRSGLGFGGVLLSISAVGLWQSVGQHLGG